MSLWSAQQREWLQALGHPALALATAGDAPPPRAAEPVPVQARAATEPRAAATAEPTRSQETPQARTPERARPAPSTNNDDALLRAVLRAAGRHPGAAPDAAVLALYDAAALRGYPAAKRALWPLLRSLRRGARA
ncbi:alanine acetyltransferase [Lysobacter sp. 5GHs7-4]|uniref:alanine acetyltransferase n=1 Tax=Lysobacter sp. 5GHs7-4 TaxID=2904253 RepID=UPI001E44881B|nr:alanine acetyltransferase [Lysobacter sp. 5GHs7-4]UHQ22640.1 alanine acetyltransferase [Lysobacter sp. 5GHs7-4]